MFHDDAFVLPFVDSFLELIVFVDSSFANNRDLSSLIGHVVILADGENNANIIHWSSVK